MTVKYQIALHSGLKEVTGETVEIPNSLGATFAVHAEEYYPDGHKWKFAVSHVDTGMALAFGSTPEAAIKTAKDRVAEKGESGLARAIARGKEVRDSITTFEDACESRLYHDRHYD